MVETSVEHERTYESIMEGYFERFVQPDAPGLTYDEYAQWGVIDTEASEPVLDVPTLEEALGIPRPEPTPEVVVANPVAAEPAVLPERRRSKPFEFARVGALVVGLIVGSAIVAEARYHPAQTSFLESSADAAPGPAADAPSTTVAPTTTTTVETTTTTEPKPIERRFERQPGDFIGSLEIPAMCENIQVYQYDEQEGINEVIGTGGAVLDRLIPDPNPETSCENTQQFAAANGLKSRMDWAKPSSQGHASQWVPVAGQPRNAQGPLSVYPGQPGNAVIAGHGSTFSAPFADTAALKPGDPIVFTRADGGKYLYQVVGRELTLDYNTIYNYENGYSDSTLSIYNCTDAQGRNGSDTTRSVVRAILIRELA